MPRSAGPSAAGRTPPSVVLWLAVRGVRAQPMAHAVRLLVGAGAVILLLLACALLPTAQNRAERLADTVPTQVPREARTEGLLMQRSESAYAGRPIREVSVARVGVGPLPQLPTVLPEPGTALVSPALAQALSTEPELRRRYADRVVGTLPAAGLVGPRELVVWRGVTPAELPAETGWVVGLGGPGAADVAATVPDELAYGYPLIALGFVLPLLALMGLLATVGAARREQRLAALRLAGLQDRAARLSAACEDGIAALLAVAVGTVAGLLVLPAVAPAVPVLGGVWPADLEVAILPAVTLVVAFPVLAVLVSVLGLRRLATGPLGVERRQAQPRVRPWAVLPLGLGLALLGLVGAGLPAEPALRAPTLLLATALLMLGTVGAVGVVIGAVAGRLAAAARSLETLLAARRLGADPARTTRVATGLTLLVVMAGPLLVLFPLIADVGAAGLARSASALPKDTLVAVSTELSPSAGERLATARGVSAAEVLPVIQLAAADGTGIRVLLADCDRLGAATGIDPASCRRGLVRDDLGTPPAGTLRRLSADGDDLPGRLRLPTDPVRSDVVETLDASGSTGASMILPVDDTTPQAWQVPGEPALLLLRPETGGLEAARTAAAAVGVDALTVEEQWRIASRSTRELTLLSLLAALLIVAVAGASTLVTAYDQLRATGAERQLLLVGGVPRPVLRRALARQVALPGLVGVVPAALLTVGLAAAFLGLLPYASTPVPWLPVAGVAGVALLVPWVAVRALMAASPAHFRIDLGRQE